MTRRRVRTVPAAAAVAALMLAAAAASVPFLLASPTSCVYDAPAEVDGDGDGGGGGATPVGKVRV